MGSILMVEDEASVVWAFKRLVVGMGHAFQSAGTAEEGVSLAARDKPDLILMDVRLPGKDGLWAIREIRKNRPDARVVVVTAHGTLETAMEAMKQGAVEYLSKPVDLDQARGLIRKLLGDETADVKPGTEPADRTGIIGRTGVMQEVFRKVAAVSQSEATVLLTGESGTGKELLARAIHNGGPRAGEPFEPINCGAIPEALLESELYGHERGAFTGAVVRKKGKLEIAGKGTVFLDEVGDLSGPSQVKLLRFLEDRVFHRVGGTEPLRADVRILAASNQNLEESIRQGRFREDLYFRLHVVKIEVPPLRERKEDLSLLVEHFLSLSGGSGIDADAMRLLKGHSWPGNVRELRSAIERGVVLARGRTVAPEHLPPELAAGASAPGLEGRINAVIDDLVGMMEPGKEEGLHRSVMNRLERLLIERVMAEVGGNQVKAAEKLGLTRVTLRKRLQAYREEEARDEG